MAVGCLAPRGNTQLSEETAQLATDPGIVLPVQLGTQYRVLNRPKIYLWAGGKKNTNKTRHFSRL